ncbi:molybdate ABC transporter substrate-binding protein, partial [Xanthomonas sp. LMG 8992]|uniref:molybdate ABC transporter substrate-binding protein n=1 Tax=Xanthomonas sp. LMG 8992 TaxID=1591157 RepID=UPI001F0235A7
MRMIGFWQRALCVLMLTLPLLAGAQAAPVTVFAAASLKESMDEAATAYEKATGTPVRVSYAASSALARQIEQGAPADVFFSADLAWMDNLQQHGLVLPAQRPQLLGTTVVLVALTPSTCRSDSTRAAASMSLSLRSGAPLTSLGPRLPWRAASASCASCRRGTGPYYHLHLPPNQEGKLSVITV